MSLNPTIECIARETRSSAALQAMLVASPDGRIQFATARADHWMRDLFAAVSPQDRLPEALTRWLSNGASGTRSKFVLDRPGQRLNIYALCHEPKSVCLLLERNSEHHTLARPRNHLTEREREVLFWVAYGKTNADIGKILGLRTRTVGKYLERIFPKLGVENRTAAARFCSNDDEMTLLPATPTQREGG